jgi:hypothetical protein
MDVRAAVVPAAQLILAGCIGILAVLGLFTSDPATAGATIVDGPRFLWLVILPMTGVVAFGLFDWQTGRGPFILRVGNIAAFAMAGVELAMGTPGFARWLAGAIALSAAAGLAGSLLIPPPRRPGFRR